MISEKLLLKLRERFGDMKMTVGEVPAPVAIFAAVHPDVGDIKIFDDGKELTVLAGKFTHGHFSDFNSTSQEEIETNVVDKVVQFLEQLFVDEIVLYGSHKGGGGWFPRGMLEERVRRIKESRHMEGPFYVWSGPLSV